MMDVKRMRNGVVESTDLSGFLADADKFRMQSDPASWYLSEAVRVIRILIANGPYLTVTSQEAPRPCATDPATNPAGRDRKVER